MLWERICPATAYTSDIEYLVVEENTCMWHDVVGASMRGGAVGAGMVIAVGPNDLYPDLYP